MLGPCPFPKETRGSFVVTDEPEALLLSGCGASRDVIDFVRRADNCGFLDSVRSTVGAIPAITLPRERDRIKKLDLEEDARAARDRGRAERPAIADRRQRQRIVTFGIGIIGKDIFCDGAAPRDGRAVAGRHRRLVAARRRGWRWRRPWRWGRSSTGAGHRVGRPVAGRIIAERRRDAVVDRAAAGDGDQPAQGVIRVGRRLRRLGSRCRCADGRCQGEPYTVICPLQLPPNSRCHN